MIASELAPLAKTGGLADVTAGLSQALTALGVKVGLVIPAYAGTLKAATGAKQTGIELRVQVGTRKITATVRETQLDGMPVFLIQADAYFEREGLYGTSQGDYPDNGERFIFFSKAALSLAERTGPWDVLHCHDWESSLIAVYRKFNTVSRDPLGDAKTVLTVHNLAYQGVFPDSQWRYLGLDKRKFFNSSSLEYYGQINFLKGGILYADAVTTVSRRYAQEILTPEYGCGLDGVLRERQEHLSGILNGVDYREWNPETDPYITQSYSSHDRRGKLSCKFGLQRTFGLPVTGSVPLVGMVARLVEQKGMDILLDSLEEIVRWNVQLVILGAGTEHYEKALMAAADRFPNIGIRIGFDNALAHRIEAGADFFLMPSRYEPCGLNQIYSLKYGTIPIVRATGGLDDTVQDYDLRSQRGNGIKFSDYSGPSLVAAVRRALFIYGQSASWDSLVTRAMACDFSWGKSAREYRALYKDICSH